MIDYNIDRAYSCNKSWIVDEVDIK